VLSLLLVVLIVLLIGWLAVKMFLRVRAKGSTAQVVDLRTPEDRAIAQRVRAGESLGPENDALVAELVDIGARDKFITTDEQELNVHNPRAKEIGRILETLGGKPLMKAAFYR